MGPLKDQNLTEVELSASPDAIGNLRSMQTTATSGMRLLEGCRRLTTLPPAAKNRIYKVEGYDIPITAAFRVDETLITKILFFQKFINPGGNILITERDSTFFRDHESIGSYAPHLGSDPLRNFSYEIKNEDRIVLVQESSDSVTLLHELAHDFYMTKLSPWNRMAFSERTSDCFYLFALLDSLLKLPIGIESCVLQELHNYLPKFYNKYGSASSLSLIETKEGMEVLENVSEASGYATIIQRAEATIIDEYTNISLEERRIACEIFADLALLTSGITPSRFLLFLVPRRVYRIPYILEDFFRKTGLYAEPKPLTFSQPVE